MKTMNQRPDHGFTLIEVLLAVAIFAIVLAAINGVFYGALRLRTKTTQALDASVPIQQALALIRQDLRGIVAPGGGPLSGTLKSAASAGGTGQQAGPELYTATGSVEAEAPWGNIQKVAYVLRPATDSRSGAGQDLIRLVSRNLLATLQDEPVEQFLMSDVARIAFSFYDGSQWRDSWDSTTEASVLPKAVRVEIDLAVNMNEGPARTPIQLVVPLVVQPNTNQTQLAGG